MNSYFYLYTKLPYITAKWIHIQIWIHLFQAIESGFSKYIYIYIYEFISPYFVSADVNTSTDNIHVHKVYGRMKSIALASSSAFSRPNSFSTIPSANSMVVPGPRLVMRLPSTTTLFSTSLWSDSLLDNAGKAVAFLPWIKVVSTKMQKIWMEETCRWYH